MNYQFADVIVDISHSRVDRSFQYEIPERFMEMLRIGSRVIVPFGARKVEGYVVGFSNEKKADSLKQILDLSKSGIRAEQDLVALAVWMRKTYGSTMIRALRTVLPVHEREKEKTKAYVRLCIPEAEAGTYIRTYENRHFTAKKRALETILLNGGIYGLSDLKKECRLGTAVISSLEKAGVVRIEEERVYRTPEVLKEQTADRHPCLSERQRAVLAKISDSFDDMPSLPVLLEGVTGSGKTQIYMELAQKEMEKGNDVIVLIPEIALSWQMVSRFVQRFGSLVSVLHSRLSRQERFDQFEKVKDGSVKIMIGPRSALFTPFSHLGCIMIDEEHEPSYQNEENPHYDAREAALKRAEISGARVLLGSATPSLLSYSRAMQGTYRLVCLKERFGNAVLPKTEIADMKAELRSGNISMLSGLLRQRMQEALERKEQILLFLNKRGYSGFISCRSCGGVIKCPHCDISLTLHKNGKMICHYCGYQTDAVKSCPSCGSPHVSGMRAGTQQIEQLVQRSFPSAKILRMDADTTGKKGGHEQIVRAFREGQADILIGTQMIVKGHDFPGVTLVGILMADLSLMADSFESAERTFQLLVQCIGRAGRAERRGTAVIQTYQPEHYSIQSAAEQNYEAFYSREMTMRALLNYPPCGHMLGIHASCKDENRLEVALVHVRRFLEKLKIQGEIQLIGPAPEGVSMIKDYYRYAVYIKGGSEAALIRMRELLENYIEINSGFADMLFQYELK